ELEKIYTTNLRDLPDLELELLSFISTFTKTSTHKICEELNRPYINLKKKYDSSIHYAYNYIKATIDDWFIEKSPNPLMIVWSK
ncbi:12902_t:CDS:2, partial [Funneliformis caledonium]